MSAYYNENDPKTAAWLRELIRQGLIADGEVDTRSIVDVRPADLAGFRQCHFFAGIGGWSYALRLAGWPDDREVWTGSCPCQPWSVAGSGEGVNDPRHLWPTWVGLIDVVRPAVIFGEQTASEDGRYWLDLVYADLEARGYAIGAANLPAASKGAPHARARLWFVANADRQRVPDNGLRPADGASPNSAGEARQQRVRAHTEPSGEALCDCGHRSDDHDLGAKDCDRCSCTYFVGALGNADRLRTERITRRERRTERAPYRGREKERRGRLQTLDSGTARHVGHANGAGLAVGSLHEDGRRAVRLEGSAIGETGATRGFWAGCDWVWHRDGVYRAVEPGAFPLVARLPGDVDRIRAFGNAIVPQVAAEVISAYMEIAEP